MGDNISADSHTQIVQAVRSVDEHLQVRIGTIGKDTRIVVSMAPPYWVSPAGAGKRLKQSGMFWTVEGANAIVALRCCMLNDRFEDYWAERWVA